MSEGSVVTGLIDAVTGNLVTDGLKAVARKSSNTSVVRKLREHLGGDGHPVLKDIASRALAQTIESVTLDQNVRRGFLNDAVNKAVVFGWIVHPESFDLDALNLQHASSYAEKKRLQIFAKRLHREVVASRDLAFSPEARAMLSSIDSLAEWIEDITLQQTETIIETVERTGDRVVVEFQTVGMQLTDRIASLESAVVAGAANSDSEQRLNVSAEAAEAGALLKSGRVLDARARAEAAVARLNEQGGDAAGELAALYKVIANSYLSGQVADEQRKAAPFLREVADRTETPSVRHRNLSFAALLEGDLPTAVKEAERAIEADPTDFKSVTAVANAYLALSRPEDAVRTMADAEALSAEPIPDLKHGQAWVALAAGDATAALHHAESALEKDPDHVGALAVATEAVVDLRQLALESGNSALSATDVEQLNTAEERTGHLIDLVNPQQVNILVGAYFRRGLYRVWLSRETEAKADLERSNELLPGSPENLRNLVSASLIAGDTEDALRYADAFEVAGGDPVDAARARARSYLLADQPELAIEALKPVADTSAGSENARMTLVLLIEAYDRDFQPDEADLLLSQMEKAEGAEGFHRLVVAERYRRLGQAELGVDDARAALAAFPDPGPYRGRSEMILADALYKRGNDGDYREAAGLYSRHATAGVDDYMSRQWAICLLRAGDLPECLRVCREIQAGRRFEVFADLESRIYLETDNFSLAADRLKWLARTRPQNVQYALNWGVCLYRLGNPERAYHTMRMVAARVSDSAESLALLSDAYVTVGKYADAVRFAHDALQLEPDDYRFHRVYISLFMGPHLRGEEEIEDRYVHAFQKSLAEYDERFPDHSFFQRFETVPDDPEAFKAQLVKLFDTPGRQQAEEIFRSGQFPLSVLTRLAGRDIVSAWGYATSNPIYGLHISTGDHDLESVEEDVCRSAVALVIDPSAALALYSAGALEEVASYYSKVYVPQSFVDDLIHIADQKRRAAEEGELTVHVEDGELYRQEVPAEAVKTFLTFVEGLRDVLLGSAPFEIIGQTPGREDVFAAYDYSQQRKALGKPSIEAMYEARSRNAVLLAGDVMTRYVMVSDEPVTTVGPVAALNVAREHGALSDDAYHDAIFKLIEQNYRFVRFNKELLCRSAVKAGFLCTDTATRPLKTLSDPRWDIASVTHVLAGFVDWLWGSGPDPASAYPAVVYTSGGALAVRTDWMRAILGMVEERSDRMNAAKLLTSIRLHVLGPAPPARREMEYDAIIEDWLLRR